MINQFFAISVVPNSLKNQLTIHLSATSAEHLRLMNKLCFVTGVEIQFKNNKMKKFRSTINHILKPEKIQIDESPKKYAHIPLVS